MNLKQIAHMECDLPTKFGLPRQSGLVDSLIGRVIIEKEFSLPEAFRELDGFSHIWLIWGFSAADKTGWSPTVRPPRLGGNKRVGVFATRSPFRPNSLGISSVKLLGIEYKNGIVELIVSGSDLMNGTPIYDIKPYLPFTDSHPDAKGGFAEPLAEDEFSVVLPDELAELIPEEKREGLIGILSQKPIPSYHNDPDRVYGFSFAEFEIRFKVRSHVLEVVQIIKQ